MRRKLILAGGVAVSAVCVGWLLRRADLREVGRAIGSVGAGSWLLAVGVYLAGFLLRGWRWRFIMRETEHLGQWRSTGAVLIGYAANNVLPFRAGEVVRAHVVGRLAGVSRLTCFGSIAAERLFDGLIVVGIFAGSLAWVLSKRAVDLAVLKPVIVVGVVFVAAAIALALIAVLRPEQVAGLVRRLFGERAGTIAGRLLEATRFFRNARDLAGVVALSAGVWFVEGSMFVILARAMHLPDVWLVGAFSLAVINLGLLVPAAPGYVGVFQACAVLAFSALGLSESSGLAFGLAVHLAQFLPVTILGFLVAAAFGENITSGFRRSAAGCEDENPKTTAPS